MGWDVNKSRFFKHLGISALISTAAAVLLAQWIELPSWQYIVLLGAACFGVVTNIDYLISYAKGKIGSFGPALSHGGFALMVIGIMASGLNKRIVSQNRFAQEGLAEGFDAGQSAFLVKDMPMFMNGYWVTYKTDTLIGFTKHYEIEFIQMGEKGDTLDKFTTFPNVLYDRKLTKVAAQNPDTKRYLDRDVFTYVDGLPPEQQDIENVSKLDSTLEYKLFHLSAGDSLRSGKFTIILDSISLGSKNPGYTSEKNDLAVSGNIRIRHDDATEIKSAYPTLLVRRGLLFGMPDQINDFNVRMRLQSTSLDSLVPMDDKLNYQPLTIHPGETKNWNGLAITMKGMDKNITHPGYRPEPEDIAIHGVFDVTTKQGRKYTMRPLYYIREGASDNLKDFIPDIGLHIRLARIDPVKEEFQLLLAQPSELPSLALEFAEEVPRNDYIVLKAILFPGINLFWAGSLIMLLGMVMGLYKRLRKT
jgi:cytochrome c-type biogenesis protein CcmF